MEEGVRDVRDDRDDVPHVPRLHPFELGLRGALSGRQLSEPGKALAQGDHLHGEVAGERERGGRKVLDPDFDFRIGQSRRLQDTLPRGLDARFHGGDLGILRGRALDRAAQTGNPVFGRSGLGRGGGRRQSDCKNGNPHGAHVSSREVGKRHGRRTARRTAISEACASDEKRNVAEERQRGGLERADCAFERTPFARDHRVNGGCHESEPGVVSSARGGDCRLQGARGAHAGVRTAGAPARARFDRRCGVAARRRWNGRERGDEKDQQEATASRNSPRARPILLPRRHLHSPTVWGGTVFLK